MKCHVMVKSDDYIILIWAINKSRPKMEELCHSLLHTAKIFNFETSLLGIGHEFKEHTQRIWILRDYLRWLDPETIVVCMDGSDTLFNDAPDQLFGKFQSMDTRILISAEKSFTHQYHMFRDRYDQIPSDYRYVNAGTFMGYAGDLLQMFEEILILNKKYPKANDQGLIGIWAYDKLEQPEKMRLDIRSEVFWVTTGDWNLLRENSEQHCYILNTLTKTKPSIIHCVGVGHPPHRRSYDRAYSNICKQSQHRYLRICILTPFNARADSAVWGYLADRKRKKDRPQPVWYFRRHPNVTVFFYGTEATEWEMVLPTNYFGEAIRLLEAKYCFDFIVHLPPDKTCDLDEMVNHLREQYHSRDVNFEEWDEYPVTQSFIYYKGGYQQWSICREPVSGDFRTNLKYEREILMDNNSHRLESNLRVTEQGVTSVISVGGWCGPAIALKQMGLRIEAFPFCYINTTAACLVEVVNKNFDAFFNVGKYTVTPHHNFEDPDTKEIMQYRLERFIERLESSEALLLVRVVNHEDYRKEFELMLEFMQILKDKYASGQKRLILVLQDQKVGTVKLSMLDYNIMVWAAAGEIGWGVPNRNDVKKNYEKIIEYGLNEENWKYDEPQIRFHKIIDHQTPGISKNLFPKISNIKKKRRQNIE